MTERRKLRRIITMLMCVGLSSAAITAVDKPADQDAKWNQVLQLEDGGTALQNKEKLDPSNKELHLERVKAFAAAGLAVRDYAANHTTDPEHIRLIYRLGLDLELSEQYMEALGAYRFCEADTAYYHTATVDGTRMDKVLPIRKTSVIEALICVPGTPPNKVLVCDTVGSAIGAEAPVTQVVKIHTNVNGETVDNDRGSFLPGGHDLGDLQINKQALRSVLSPNVMGGGVH
jgi:hypothetical protein